jgi:acetylornithine deacetylase
MFGRGAFDMKGGIAGIMVAGVRALARGLRGDLLLALVADEEHSSLGPEEALGSFRADGAIVCEPTNLDVVPAHKGFAWFDIEVEGLAAHGSRPDLGIDAIAKAGHFLVAVGIGNPDSITRPPRGTRG